MSDNEIDARAEIACGVRHPAFAEPKQCMVLAVNGNPVLVNGEPITKPANVRDVRCNRPLGHDGPHQVYTFYITSLTEWIADELATARPDCTGPVSLMRRLADLLETTS